MRARSEIGAAKATLWATSATPTTTLGEYRRAIEFYEQRLAIAREIGDRRGEGNALGNLGNAYRALGDTRRAIEFYEQHWPLRARSEIGAAKAPRLGNLGNAYTRSGSTAAPSSSTNSNWRLRARSEIGGEASALFNSASALAALSDRVEAIARAEAALKIFEEIESPYAATARQALAEWRGLK